MNCPKCRREIPFNAMEHKVCGWKLASREHADSIKTSSPTWPSKEERAARIAQLKAILKRPLPAPRGAREATPPREEVTPGHGAYCFCEICFAVRVDPERRAKRAALAAKFPVE